MTASAHESARDRSLTTGPRAQDPTPLKAGPMGIFAHLPACFRYWHFSRSLRPSREDVYAEVWAEINAIWDEIGLVRDDQGALDKGVVETGAMADRAHMRVEAMAQWIREQAEAADLPSGEELTANGKLPISAAERIANQMKVNALEAEFDDWMPADEPPAGHPDSLTRQLDEAAEETFIALLCCAEDQGETGGAS